MLITILTKSIGTEFFLARLNEFFLWTCNQILCWIRLHIKKIQILKVALLVLVFSQFAFKIKSLLFCRSPQAVCLHSTDQFCGKRFSQQQQQPTTPQGLMSNDGQQYSPIAQSSPLLYSPVCHPPLTA